MDTLVKKLGERQSFEKKIILVTYCGENEFKDVEDAAFVITECRKREIKIDVVYVPRLITDSPSLIISGIEFDVNPNQSHLNETKSYNETVLRALVHEVNGVLVFSPPHCQASVSTLMKQ